MDIPRVPDFRHTGLDSPIAELAIMLVGQKDGIYSALGSGVIIGPGIGITCLHVIEGFWRHYSERPVGPAGGAANFSLVAIHLLGGTRGLCWNIRKIEANSKDTDIAFLHLSGGSPNHASYKWKPLKLQLLPPLVGSTVSAFGYPGTMTSLNSSRSVDVLVNPRTSTGVVEEVHPVGRDAALLPFPCFRTNARFDGGMSGGPVFSSEGHLCGLICSNMPPERGDEPHTSYVTLLWPSMGTLVSFPIDSLPPDQSYRALELITRGYLKAVDGDQVNIEVDASNGDAILAAQHSK